NAWGVFGAAFGPTILLSLFWRRLNFGGAVAGIVCGALADILWLAFLKGTGLYEIIPGFVIGLVAAIVVSLLTPAPDANVQALFDRATSPAGD
ncbi:MAG: sodium:proline symporter, partial [Eubacteriales bacterium]